MRSTLLAGTMLLALLTAAQQKDEYVFETGDDNVVFVETLELQMEQAFVPAGLYFGWLLKNRLQSDFIMEVADYTLEEFDAKESSGPELFMTDWEGVLSGELMNNDAFAFSKHYYKSGKYEEDLLEVFALGSSSIYTIEDTWENFDKISARLDQRYAEWQASRRGNK